MFVEVDVISTLKIFPTLLYRRDRLKSTSDVSRLYKGNKFQNNTIRRPSARLSHFSSQQSIVLYDVVTTELLPSNYCFVVVLSHCMALLLFRILFLLCLIVNRYPWCVFVFYGYIKSTNEICIAYCCVLLLFF